MCFPQALSSFPKRPLRETVIPHGRDLRIQKTKDSQANPTSPSSKRKHHHEAGAPQTSLEPPRKRTRVSLAGEKENLERDQASTSIEVQSERVLYWSEYGTWPPESKERRVQSFRDNYVSGALATRRSSPIGRKRSSGSLVAETVSSGDQKTLSEKNPYRDGQVRIDLKEFGSFMNDHAEGITTESRTLCQKLLNSAQKLPEGTLFSDELFPQVCEIVKGKKEATVVRYILPELVPSPKIRALRGASHLKILNETVGESWINAKRCCNRRPQPDYGIGIDREAFSLEQIQKLQPYIGAQLDEESQFTATYDTCFPFLTTEVKCGAAALDVADLQNAVSQTLALRGLVTLFRLVHREQELHRKVLGFSISHDNEMVRIYGHYPFINGKSTTYHRCRISLFDILPTIEGDNRWKTPTFVQNVQDLWAGEHFKTICSAVDALQLEAESSQQCALSSQLEHDTQGSAPSGLSQQLDSTEIAEELHTGDTPITPDASTHTGGRKKNKTGGIRKAAKS